MQRTIVAIAGSAHGVVTRAQLLHAGLSRDEIRDRLRSGVLLGEHPGVYRVGHRAPHVEARYLAAVRACGPGALLSGLAGAHFLAIVAGLAPAPEVTAPTERRLAGVTTHRSALVCREFATTRRGVPVTTVPCTLVDIAAALDLDQLARACHEAAVRFSTTPAQVEAVLRRRPNAPGAGGLRRVLRGDVHVTLSALERRFLALLRRARLPLPRTNRPAGGRRVDCRWAEPALTVELDGYRYHGSRHAWETDRRREREAYARGDQFRRYTYGDVFEDPRPMLRELTALLSQGNPG